MINEATNKALHTSLKVATSTMQKKEQPVLME